MTWETDDDDRPDALASTTQRIDTGWGRVYVTIGADDDGPVEVFVVTGQSGGVRNTQAEALGKMLSAALQEGGDPARLADTLLGIRSARIDYDNGDQVYSIPDAVGLALKRFVEGRLGASVRDNGAAAPGEESP